MAKDVLVLLGSKSDMAAAEETTKMLDELHISYDLEVSSAHRHPDKTSQLAREAEQNGYKVVICLAGMAAHLPGVVAAHTNLPVIGVPLDATLGGVDSLLSMTQMPPGIPVATVATGTAGARNSAVLAARILSLSDKSVAERHKTYRDSL